VRAAPVLRGLRAAALVVLLFGIPACAENDPTDTTAQEASPTVVSAKPCADGTFAPILPTTRQLNDSLHLVVLAANAKDLAALGEAGTSMVTAGANLQRVARDAQPCSAPLRRAKKLIVKAGAHAVYAGLGVQGAVERANEGAVDAAFADVELYRRDLTGVGRVLDQATRLIDRKASHSRKEVSWWGFQTPSGNIVCNSDDESMALACAVLSESTEKGQRIWTLGRTSRSRVAYVWGNIGTDVRVLEYGRTWRGDALTCTSRRTGLMCRNRVGHGFFLSRERQRIF
jgi:Family of unknown function (DUF6636)